MNCCTLAGPLRLQPGHDVHQYQSADRQRTGLSDGQQCADATKGGADHDSRLFQGRQNATGVLHEAVQAVVAVGTPVAFTMAAHIHGHGPIAVVGQRARQLAPGVPGLATAMQHHHRLIAGMTGDIGGESEPARAVEINLLHHLVLCYGPAAAQQRSLITTPDGAPAADLAQASIGSRQASLRAIPSGGRPAPGRESPAPAGPGNRFSPADPYAGN